MVVDAATGELSGVVVLLPPIAGMTAKASTWSDGCTVVGLGGAWVSGFGGLGLTGLGLTGLATGMD